MKSNVKESSPRTLSAKPARLSELVEYQDGSIVSRTIIDKETGTVTLFAFDQGQGLSEHTAPFDALVLVLDGEAEVTVSQQPHRLTQGEMIIMPAGQPHSLKALKKFKMMLTMIRSYEARAINSFESRGTIGS
jgi:quercetin dioxygenase-like cupin family protein